MYENGLPIPPTNNAALILILFGGRVPANPLQVTNAFNNDPASRPYQDVGFDGLRDDDEKTKFSPYVSLLGTNFGTGSLVYIKSIVRSI